MARYRVTCIHKRGSHFDPHERTAYIGSDEGKWKLSEDEAISYARSLTSKLCFVADSASFTILQLRKLEISSRKLRTLTAHFSLCMGQRIRLIRPLRRPRHHHCRFECPWLCTSDRF